MRWGGKQALLRPSFRICNPGWALESIKVLIPVLVKFIFILSLLDSEEQPIVQDIWYICSPAELSEEDVGLARTQYPISRTHNARRVGRCFAH
jgi:hypothetical protein